MISFLLAGFLIFATGLIEIGDSQEVFDEELFRIFHRASKRLERVAQQRPFKLAAMNDSLAKTALALHAMMTTSDAASLSRLLAEAREDYGDNHFITLLEAVAANAQNNLPEANRLFEQFLMKNRAYTDFDAAFLDWSEFHRLRRIVYELLKSRRVSFKGREKEIQAVIPFEEFMKYLIHPRGRDLVMSVMFVILLLGGAVLFVLAGLSSFAFIGPFLSHLPLLYGVVWLAYLIWLIDLGVGLPFHASRHAVIPALFGVSLALFLISGLADLWKEKHRPLEEGYRRCPHCNAVILILSVECSDCGRKI